MNGGRWQKLGCIFTPDNRFDWMFSHAAVPVAELLYEDTFRIYFSSRTVDSVSHTGYVDINLTEPFDIKDLSQTPVLSPGKLGEFDDSGAMGSWLLTHNNLKYFYYIGWNLGATVPFRNSIGLASLKGDKFERIYSGPIVDRTRLEPHFCASCCVLVDKDGWHMWYLNCTEWIERSDGSPEHRYHIKYAHSEDGIRWNREGLVAIDYLSDDEIAISRPSVMKVGEKWHMWYSYRTKHSSYRIGYAVSDNRIDWTRLDHLVGIQVSDAGWDSEMIEYPFVFEHKAQIYMLYNGNGYGESGIGLATWKGA